MMYYTWGVMLPPPPPKAFQTVRKYEIHSAETLIWGSFRTMSVRSGGDPPVKFSPETTYFRVPMETVHVILVVSGPSAKLWTGTQVRVLDGAPFRKLRCQFNVPSTANVAEAVDHIVSESIRRHALYK